MASVTGERQFFSISEVAVMTGWSEDTVRRMVKDGRIPSIRSGPRGSHRIPGAWIERVKKKPA